MATHLLSRYEREYIVSGVNEDFRADGRTCRDFRHFSLESGVVSNTSGSAKIQLVSSATQLSPAAQAREFRKQIILSYAGIASPGTKLVQE